MNNKNKYPALLSGLLLTTAAQASNNYSDYFDYDVSEVRYVETTANNSKAVTAEPEIIYSKQPPQPVVTHNQQPITQQQPAPQLIQHELVYSAPGWQPPKPAAQTVPVAQPYSTQNNTQTPQALQPQVISQTPQPVQAQATAQPEGWYSAPIPQLSHETSGYEMYADQSQPIQPAQVQPTAPLQPVNHTAALNSAIEAGRVDLVKSLHAQGANLLVADAQGLTYLHKAAAAGRTALVQFLLSAGVNPNARTVKNWTPLHHAARFGHASVVSQLLAAGANPQQVNSDGFRPKQLAINVKQMAVAALLH
ncbi:MAG: ankyrin repeat domain-containing protein [Thiolinea sp.]